MPSPGTKLATLSPASGSSGSRAATGTSLASPTAPAPPPAPATTLAISPPGKIVSILPGFPAISGMVQVSFTITWAAGVSGARECREANRGDACDAVNANFLQLYKFLGFASNSLHNSAHFWCVFALVCYFLKNFAYRFHTILVLTFQTSLCYFSNFLQFWENVGSTLTSISGRNLNVKESGGREL